MIKAEDGHVTISGNAKDVTDELSYIIGGVYETLKTKNKKAAEAALVNIAENMIKMANGSKEWSPKEKRVGIIS